MNRRRLVILAVVAAGLLAAWRLAGRGEESPDAAAASAEEGTSRRRREAVTLDKVPVVLSETALPGSGEIFVRERNLFEFAQSPEELQRIEQSRKAAEEARRLADEKRREDEARLAEIRRKEKEEADRAAAEIARKKALEPYVPPPPVPPSFPYQYVGTIGPVGDPFAILTGPDRTYRYVRAGETIDREFVLEYIAENRLDLSYTDERFENQFHQVHLHTETTARR